MASPVDRLPERLEGEEGLLLLRWRPGDAEEMAEAVAESAEDLRPWMHWMADEPLSMEARRELIRGWEEDWKRGGDVHMAIVFGGGIAGGAGLSHRQGPGILEIGYWVRSGCQGRGLATRASRLLAAAALAVPGIEHVEIRPNKANERSGRIPARLGFTLAGEAPSQFDVPAGTGIDCVWRLSRR